MPAGPSRAQQSRRLQAPQRWSSPAAELRVSTPAKTSSSYFLHHGRSDLSETTDALTTADNVATDIAFDSNFQTEV
jgi:hypothetical protein